MESVDDHRLVVRLHPTTFSQTTPVSSFVKNRHILRIKKYSVYIRQGSDVSTNALPAVEIQSLLYHWHTVLLSGNKAATIAYQQWTEAHIIWHVLHS